MPEWRGPFHEPHTTGWTVAIKPQGEPRPADTLEERAGESRCLARNDRRQSRAMMLLSLLLALQGRTSLGVFESWGAFRDASPRHCFAIAEPVTRGVGDARPFVSVASWPRDHVHNQLHVRLSRERHEGAGVTLSIGERRFELIAGRSDAWAPDARTDAAIVSAMRGGRSMSVETLAANGAPFADVYALKGAATAIDAAALGCIKP